MPEKTLATRVCEMLEAEGYGGWITADTCAEDVVKLLGTDDVLVPLREAIREEIAGYELRHSDGDPVLPNDPLYDAIDERIGAWLQGGVDPAFATDGQDGDSDVG